MTQPITPQPTATIIASRPGIMRQSLRAFLSSYEGLIIIATSGDGLTALNQVLTHRPGLLVIDSNLLDEEVEALLVQVKSKAPQTRCLICVQSSQREARLLALGADAVIKRDSSSQQLQETLSQLAQAAPW
jgi:DNA-binding NarL/FixJ family response regulator